MTIDDAARAAKVFFTADVQQTMVAIAMAESGGDPQAEGDNLASFSPIQQAMYADFAINDWLSLGLWQIFLGVHTGIVEEISRTTDKEAMRRWLFEPTNNALIAREIYDSQGFKAWSTYNNGAYKNFLGAAAVACAKATGTISPSPDAAIVAVSINGSLLHFDLSDGTFLEARTNDAGFFGGWLRLELEEDIPYSP